jgi:Flp pilus assembly protein TadG
MKTSLLRSESGTSMTELALAAPILALLLMGVIDVGRYMYFAILAANAARAGVAYGAQNVQTAGDLSGMESAALSDGQSLSQWTAGAQTLCSTNGATLITCASSSVPPAGTLYYVKVQVSGTFQTLATYPGIPNNVPISGSAVMRVIDQ